jgi:hypothetical protein
MRRPSPAPWAADRPLDRRHPGHILPKRKQTTKPVTRPAIGPAIPTAEITSPGRSYTSQDRSWRVTKVERRTQDPLENSADSARKLTVIRGGTWGPRSSRSGVAVSRRSFGVVRSFTSLGRVRKRPVRPHDRRLPGEPGAYWVHGPDHRDNHRRDPCHLACRHGCGRDLRNAQDVPHHRADRDGRLHRGVARGQGGSPRLAGAAAARR